MAFGLHLVIYASLLVACMATLDSGSMDKFTLSLQEEATTSAQHNVIIMLEDSTGTKTIDIEVLQKRVIAQLTVEPTYTFKHIPAVKATMSHDDINRAALLDDVKSIELSKVLQKSSTESFPITGVDVVQDTLGFDGTGMVIAVIDDAIEYTHPAFGGTPTSTFPTTKVIAGFDVADNDADVAPDCPADSHGTSVAGVTAGDGGGVLGVAPKASLLFYKVGQGCEGPLVNIDIALEMILDYIDNGNRVDFINMSLGGGAYTTAADCDADAPAVFALFARIEAAGVVTFVASGNEGHCDKIAFPACLSNTVSVGATYDDSMGFFGWCVDATTCLSGSPGCEAGSVFVGDNSAADQVTSYSNSADFLDILAPSHCAFTADTGGTVNNCFGGTSSACPFACGVAALVKQAAGGTPVDVAQLLASTGVAIIDGKNSIAKPRVNGLAAVNAAAPVAVANNLFNSVVTTILAAVGSIVFGAAVLLPPLGVITAGDDE